MRATWLIGSVRWRITAAATFAVLVVLVATGGALVTAQRSVLTDNVDENLRRHSRAIIAIVDAGTLPAVISGQGDDESFARVTDAAGREIAATAHSLADARLAGSPGSGDGFQTMRSSPGPDFRLLATTRNGLRVLVGTPLDDVQDSVDTLLRGLLIAVPAASLLLAVVVWLLVGRVLRPVEAIRRRVAGVSGSTLNRKVPEPKTQDEIARLARTMNEMLERVETADTRQRRFVADASHELRTPLARIRAQLEVDRAHPEEADAAATRQSVLDEADTLQRLIDDLLLLARADNAQEPRVGDLVDLDDVVMAEACRMRGTESVSVDVSRVSGAQVRGNRDRLARVVRNLLDNAAQHGGPQIVVSLREVGGQAELTVADDGPGIPAAEQGRVFERFARVDEARSQGGSGLGLAIAREIVAAHGGAIVIDPLHRPGARFVVTLPIGGKTARSPVS
ncbi:cell wall metabolism sensor histidine kinase WalK [Cryobacterium sp. HLT2-28]|uniref:sensor histidine kinase n=1 Tax=Cryobacterium sp. HLT2-28 TaxID=1259146 RepID=UPI00106C4A9E|nr:HAMP domain-containing sensor histidine kinase [Cryobacterium sp. HLT2-28]TFB97292.1 HAMP domain-containing histidine kinase [Cryobacterium sp. HLT2-28]